MFKKQGTFSWVTQYITSESAVSRTNFSTLLLTYFYEIYIFGFPCCSTREDLSIDVSITSAGLILTKLRWFQLVSTSQNWILNFFGKKNQIFVFPCCSTREDLSIDVSITNVGLILTKLWWFLFSGYGQMDRRTRICNPHMKTCRHTKNFNSKLVVKLSISPEDMDA